MKFTAKDLDKLKAEGKIVSWKFIDGRDEKGIKRSKYGNQRTEIDGIVFSSQREANRYIQLRYLLKAGEIEDLELQVEYQLNDGGNFSYKYKADFRYKVVKTGEIVVEDSKGCRTREYKKKRALMLKLYNIKIKET